MQYRAEIDGLRAVAVVPVILFHAGFGAFSGGYVGVDVFFVISGFLITHILVDEVQRGQFSILRFYERRARRILPALFAVLLVCLPFAWLWLLPEQLEDFAASLGSVLVFLSNLYFLSQADYFAPSAELQPLLHTWSLGVEEQYYLVFPLLVVLALRAGVRRLLWVTLGLSLASLAVSEVGNRVDAGRNFLFTLSRFWELGIGSLCAMVAMHRPGLRSGPLAGLGLALILAAVLLFDRDLPSGGVFTLVPVIGAALVLLYCRADTLTGRVLAHRVPVGVGLVSYSAYLVHQPLFAFTRIRSAEEPGGLLMAGLCLVALGLGWLSWRFIETPFRGQRAVFFPGRRGFAGAFTAAAVALMAVAVTIRQADGFPNRVEERFAGEIGAEHFLRETEARFFPCTPEALRQASLAIERRDRCFQSKADLPVTVAVIGDSHAEHIFAGVADGLPEEVVAVYLRNTVPFHGDRTMQDIYAELARNPQVKAVVFAMHWPRRYVEFDDPEGFRTGLQETLGYLKGLGLAVIVVGDLPWFASEPPPCKFEVFPGNERYCSNQRSDALALRRVYGPILTEVTGALDLPLVPVREVLCDGEACSMERDGMILLRDSNHLNLAGSGLVGGRVAEAVRARLAGPSAP